jgi:chromosome segregation ATPase
VNRPSDIEARLARVEARVEEAAADAAAARHLAAARDRDLADLAVKVEANRSAINALGVQTAARFDRLEGRFDRLEGRFDRLEGRVDGLEGRFDVLEGRFDVLEAKVDRGFAEMRGRLDGTAAGLARIVELLERRDGA